MQLLLRDRYRLLSDIRCRTPTTEAVHVSDFDSIDRVLNGHEVSVSLPGVDLCRLHQIAYRKHVADNACSNIDCSERGYVNLDKHDPPLIECMHRMKLRLKIGGVGKGEYRNPEDNLSVASSRGPSLKHDSKPSKKTPRVSSRSDSPELGDDELDIPSSTKQLNAVKPINLFNPKKKSNEPEHGLWQSPQSSSEEEGGLTGRRRLTLPDRSQPTRKSKSTKLPCFLQKPTLRPAVPPVEVEFGRLAQHVESDNLDRIIDCLGTLADK